MVAAENDGIAGAKVGGIADVTRDVPLALVDSAADRRVTSVIPCHGFLHRLPSARWVDSFGFSFRGRGDYADVYEIEGKTKHKNIRHLVIRCGGESSRIHRLYHDDPPGRPFASDADKFARFGAAVAAWIEQGRIDPSHLHLHDWHAAFVLILRRYAADDSPLKRLPTAFTIHNLAYQGIRPLRGESSALESWHPGLPYRLSDIGDPRFRDWRGDPQCVNPMAAGIRLADRVHVVSPTYAREIQRPSYPSEGFYGGEGLERDLQQADHEGRLFGILNGCYYHDQRKPLARSLRSYQELLKLAQTETTKRIPSDRPAHDLAMNRINQWLAEPSRPTVLMTAVTRVVHQKVALMCGPGRPALDRVLEALDSNARLILLGTGDPYYEELLQNLSRGRPGFLFLPMHSPQIADALYDNGDLFLMPSSYEPCGISQMLAMRAGQACVVHGVGGLADTVRDGVTGYVFNGNTMAAQADAFVDCVARAVSDGKQGRLAALGRAAAAERFLWSDSIRRYFDHLYVG